MSVTETPVAARLKHRLYVVLPLFLALAIAGTGGRSGASLFDESAFTQSGTVVAGKSFIETDVAGFRLKGWNGAFEVDTTNPAKLTLAAITTPVIASRNDDTWLVPVGMQLTIDLASYNPSIAARRPLPLPAHYLRERLPEAEAVWAAMPMPSVPEPADTFPPLLDVSLQLSKAHSEAERGDAERRLWTLSDALVRNDLLTFDTVVTEARTAEALQDADLRTLFTQAFYAKRDMQLLSYMLDDAHTATLLRFHPLTRDRVWLAAEADAHLLLLAQSLQPMSDRGTEAASPIAIRAWHDGWTQLSTSESMTADLFNSVIPPVVADIAALDAAGYPARARGYAQALVNGVHLTGAPDAQAALDALRALYDVPLAVTSALTEVVIEPMAEEVVESAETSSVRSALPEADVRALLIAEGCMFTSQSTLHLRDDGLYDISGVAIGTPSGDQVINFTFDSAAGLVSGIEQDGTVLPYSLPLTKYLEWVKMTR